MDGCFIFIHVDFDNFLVFSNEIIRIVCILNRQNYFVSDLRVRNRFVIGVVGGSSCVLRFAAADFLFLRLLACTSLFEFGFSGPSTFSSETSDDGGDDDEVAVDDDGGDDDEVSDDVDGVCWS